MTTTDFDPQEVDKLKALAAAKHLSVEMHYDPRNGLHLRVMSTKPYRYVRRICHTTECVRRLLEIL